MLNFSGNYRFCRDWVATLSRLHSSGFSFEGGWQTHRYSESVNFLFVKSKNFSVLRTSVGNYSLRAFNAPVCYVAHTFGFNLSRGCKDL